MRKDTPNQRILGGSGCGGMKKLTPTIAITMLATITQEPTTMS